MKIQNTKFGIHKWLISFCILNFALLAGCGVSVPNLENPACTDSRESVKRFYSYHFDAGAAQTPEGISAREKYLTPEFFGKLRGNMLRGDPFTLTEEFPRSFRLAGCEAYSPEKTVIKVLLLWKNDEESRQSDILVETIKQNETWLINRIFKE